MKKEKNTSAKECPTVSPSENHFGLQTQINGKDAVKYMAELLEKNEQQTLEIERGKLDVAILKQMNNRSRLLLDAAKFEQQLKEQQ